MHTQVHSPALHVLSAMLYNTMNDVVEPPILTASTTSFIVNPLRTIWTTSLTQKCIPCQACWNTQQGHKLK